LGEIQEAIGLIGDKYHLTRTAVLGYLEIDDSMAASAALAPTLEPLVGSDEGKP
jgi:hypothetical protein